MMYAGDSGIEAFHYFVREYKSKTFRDLDFEFEYSAEDDSVMRRISDRRADNRIRTYIDPHEIARVKQMLESKPKSVSIRLGLKKEGRGLHATRGDFCMVGAVLEGPRFTVLYRSLDLIGGFLYDLCVFDYLLTQICPHRIERTLTIRIFAVHANIQAMKGNSNELLFEKMKRLLRE